MGSYGEGAALSSWIHILTIMLWSYMKIQLYIPIQNLMITTAKQKGLQIYVHITLVMTPITCSFPCVNGNCHHSAFLKMTHLQLRSTRCYSGSFVIRDCFILQSTFEPGKVAYICCYGGQLKIWKRWGI